MGDIVRVVLRRRTAVLVLVGLFAVTACSRDGGYDIDAICDTADLPIATVDDLNKVRDAVGAAAPDELGDPPAGKPFKKFRLGIKLGTEAGEAAAPYAIPKRLQPTDLPAQPDTTEVRKAQQELAKACE